MQGFIDCKRVVGLPRRRDMVNSEKREQRILDAPLLTFEIQELITRLKNEETWKNTEKNSITLNMGAGLRMVIVALHEGASLEPHKANHPISVQVLEGELEFGTDAQTETLKKGQILMLHQSITHRVKAHTECAFLLTFGS